MSGNQGMDSLIPLINKIQDAFSDLETSMSIDLVYLRLIEMFCILEEFLCHVLIKPFINVDSGWITLCLLIWSVPCPSRCKNIRCPVNGYLNLSRVNSNHRFVYLLHVFAMLRFFSATYITSCILLSSWLHFFRIVFPDMR